MVVTSPSPGRTASLTSVDAVASDDVWAAGNYDNGTTFLPLVEHWNGSSWTVMSSPKTPNATMQVITAQDLKDVWLAGASSQGHGDDWFIQHWDGTHWMPTTPAQWATGIVNAAVTTRDAVWAMGTYRSSACGPDWALIQRWDGTSWTYVRSLHDGHSL